MQNILCEIVKNLEILHEDHMFANDFGSHGKVGWMKGVMGGMHGNEGGAHMLNINYCL